MGYKDADKQREFQREWMRSRRSSWIESKGGKCAKCESIDRLEVDHIDPALKTMHPRAIWSRRQEVQDAELSNCQVLCYVCHKKKTSSERKTASLICGTYTRYSKGGCRCDMCRQANRDRVRRQRENARSKALGINTI